MGETHISEPVKATGGSAGGAGGDGPQHGEAELSSSCRHGSHLGDASGQFLETLGGVRGVCYRVGARTGAEGENSSRASLGRGLTDAHCVLCMEQQVARHRAKCHGHGVQEKGAQVAAHGSQALEDELTLLLKVPSRDSAAGSGRIPIVFLLTRCSHGSSKSNRRGRQGRWVDRPGTSTEAAGLDHSCGAAAAADRLGGHVCTPPPAPGPPASGGEVEISNAVFTPWKSANTARQGFSPESLC